ncbi:cell division protein FtsX [Zavarzinia sp.]|uniref:cell division protein FtsX n=1 Tax=Zavarzinia sp. TaxID=2027920 RepID=UPI003BB664AC
MLGRLDLLPRGALSTRLVPAIIAVMVLLLTLAATGAIGIDRSLASFQSELAGRYTVELPTAEAGAVDDETVAKVVDLLAETPGVIAAEVVPMPTMQRLLEPWLGRDAAVGDLPLPVLIDIASTPGAVLDAPALAARLNALVKGARVEAAIDSMEEIAEVAGAIELAAYAIVGLVAFCLVAVVVFATRSGLDAQHGIIEIAHQLGARGATIAREFQLHFLALGAVGGAIGVVLAGIVIYGLALFAGSLDSPFLPSLDDFLGGLLPLLAIPPAVAVLTTATAGLTVSRALRRMV